MTILKNAVEGAKVKVKKIGEAPWIRHQLNELGIYQGVVLKILEVQHKRWLYPGLLRIKVNDRIGVISQHLAEKVVVEKNGEIVRLANLYYGEKRTIFAEYGKLEEKELLSKIGIKAGAVIEVIGQLPDDLLVFDIEEEEKKLSPNVATQIWVSLNGMEVQLNYLPQNILSEIVDIVSNEPARQALYDSGFVKGKCIKLKQHEKIPVNQNIEECSLFIEHEGSLIRLNLELAKQVWVEKVLN